MGQLTHGGDRSYEGDIPIPRAQISVVISTRLSPDRNSCMMASRSFCVISPCMAETVKLDSRILSASQSTFHYQRDAVEPESAG